MELGDGKGIDLDWSRGRIFDKVFAEYFLRSMKEAKAAT